MKITTLLASLLLAGNMVCPAIVLATNNTAVVSKTTTNPTMPSLNNLYACDDNYDGFAVFNLTTQTPIILAAQSSSTTSYSVNYYLSQADANADTNPIATPSAYTNTSNQQVIYVRIQLNGTTQYAIGSFALMIQNLVIPTFSPIGQICQDDTAPVLQTTSNNSVSGTWSPASINTSFPSTNTFVFTPSPGQCSTNITMTVFVSPSPNVSNIPTLMKVCDDDAQPNNGYTTFDIPSFIGSIADATIDYYTNVNYSQLIPNPSSFTNMVTGSQTIYLKITHTSGCVKYKTLTLQVLPIPTPQTNPLIISVCDANNDGIESIDITQNASYILNGATDVSLHYFNTLTDLFNTTNEILAPNNAYVTGNIWIKVESNSFIDSNYIHCYIPVQQQIQIHPSPTINGIGYSIVNNSGIQTLTVETTGTGTYGYVLDGGALQGSPIFENISVGNHTITIADLLYGCTTTITNINVNLTTTSPPTTVNNLQTLSPGATLASIQVTGQNIKWYSGMNKNATSTPLPLSTVLVDGTTYYASQTIGGYESTTRLPVTVHLALSSTQFELKGLTYAPNPVTNNLSIQSDDVIDSVSIYTFLGQLISSKKNNATSCQVDVTALNSGIYFVKLTSENKQSTIKIEKQ